tara:strand:+ start:329 stop:712 length:384 start_codon:yes stop_codon:yes gene_type:complete
MSTLNVANITDNTTSVPTGYVVNGSAKAWVAQDTSGSNITRASLNISSFTDDGVGDYKFTFSNAFSGALTYSPVGSTDTTTGGVCGATQFNTTLSTSSVLDLEVKRTSDGTKSDSNLVSVHVHGDLA